MESVWWVFAQMHEKGLVYQGYKVMPFSTACGTPLSNFEAGLNYKDVQDPAVVVAFPLVDVRMLFFFLGGGGSVRNKSRPDDITSDSLTQTRAGPAHVAAGVDDHALDAAVQPGAVREPRDGLRQDQGQEERQGRFVLCWWVWW